MILNTQFSFFYFNCVLHYRGDRSNARTFSKKGQDLNREMKQAHRQAALILFQSRNADVSKLCNDGMIDLHGLHVSEAEELMEELLPIYLHYYQHGHPH